MKVRVQSAMAARVSCPVCRSPVAVQSQAESKSPEFRAELPTAADRTPGDISRQRAMKEFQPDPEFIPTLGNRVAGAAESRPAVPVSDEENFLRDLKPTDEEHDGKHFRVKKRRKKTSESRRDRLTDWDTVAEALPEAEIHSDTWLAPVPIPEEVIIVNERDVVVGEHLEDGQTVRRVKRVRRRAIFTLAQLFFRRLSYGMRVLAIAMVSGIGIGGVWYGIRVFRQKFTPVTLEDVVAEERPARVFLSSQDESGAADAVVAFLAAEGVEQKLPHVRLPNRVRPLMEAWYQKYPDKAAKAGEVKSRAKTRAGDAYFVIVEMDVTAPDPGNPDVLRTEPRSFAVEEFEKDLLRSYKVDWETSVEWREMSFADFKSKQPRTPVPFRIKIRGGDYYNHGFTDENKWLASELYYPYPDGRNEFQFYGYLDRGSKAWEQLAIYTEPGNNASVIVTLRYPEDAVSRDQVIIDSLVHPSWFYTKDVPPEGFDAPPSPAPAEKSGGTPR